MKWPCRREPALPPAEEKAAGRRLRAAFAAADEAMDEAGIGTAPESEDAREGTEEK